MCTFTPDEIKIVQKAVIFDKPLPDYLIGNIATCILEDAVPVELQNEALDEIRKELNVPLPERF